MQKCTHKLRVYEVHNKVSVAVKLEGADETRGTEKLSRHSAPAGPLPPQAGSCAPGILSN